MQKYAKLQLSLVIIKPHIMKVPHALEEIRNIIINNGFYVIMGRRTVMTCDTAAQFYAEHRNKFFYNRLVTFMCSGLSEMHILAHNDAINKWRNLMGPTKVYQAQYTDPDSIRGKFGISDTQNATHGSDSTKSSAREIKIMFPEFSIEKWYREEEPHFRQGTVNFCKEEFVHRLYINNN